MWSVFVLCSWRVLYGSKWHLCAVDMIEVFGAIGYMLGLRVYVLCFLGGLWFDLEGLGMGCMTNGEMDWVVCLV